MFAKEVVIAPDYSSDTTAAPKKGEGPIAIICAPTRELAHQIFLETRKFAKGFGIKSVSQSIACIILRNSLLVDLFFVAAGVPPCMVEFPRETNSRLCELAWKWSFAHL